MKSRILIFLSVGMLLLAPTRASEEQIFLNSRKTVTLTTWSPSAHGFGEIKVTYAYSPIAKTQKLKDVAIEIRGTKIDVPQQSLDGHPVIIMESARVSLERRDETEPWIYLSFQLRADKEKRYYIAFNGGRFSKTFVRPQRPMA